MKIEQITKYTTEDGKVFYDKKEAEEHEVQIKLFLLCKENGRFDSEDWYDIDVGSMLNLFIEQIMINRKEVIEILQSK